MFRSLTLALISVYAVFAFLAGGCGETQTQQPDFAYTVAPTASNLHPGTTDTEILSFSVINNYFQDFSGMPFSVFDLNSGSPTTAIFTGNVTAFGAGAVVALTATLPPPSVGGLHTYSVVLDPANLVAESDEANNTANVAPLTYANGDLSFTTANATVAPASPTVNDPLQFTFGINFVANGTAGTVSNLPYTIAEDGVQVFVGNLPALTPNNVTIVTTPALPAATAGAHTYVITIDPNGLLPETDKTNNSQSTPILVSTPG
jgi:hypothetical protein